MCGRLAKCGRRRSCAAHCQQPPAATASHSATAAAIARVAALLRHRNHCWAHRPVAARQSSHRQFGWQKRTERCTGESGRAGPRGAGVGAPVAWRNWCRCGRACGSWATCTGSRSAARAPAAPGRRRTACQHLPDQAAAAALPVTLRLQVELAMAVTQVPLEAAGRHTAPMRHAHQHPLFIEQL